MQLKSFPKIPVRNSIGTRVSRQNLRRVPCSPPHLEMRADSLQFERNPDFPSNIKPLLRIENREEPRVSCHKLKGHCVPTQLEIRPDSPAPTLWNPDYPLTHERKSDSPVAPLEKAPASPPPRPPNRATGGKHPFHNSRGKRIPCLNSR